MGFGKFTEETKSVKFSELKLKINQNLNSTEK
jgi:hypothetical protein